MNKKYLLFDLDGTLTDSAKGIINCIKYALKELNVKIPDKETLNMFIGPPLMYGFSKYCNMDTATAKTALKKFRERYGTVGLYENAVYPEVEDTLKRLKENGKVIILATAKPQEYAERITEHFGLLKYFDCLVGATFDGRISNKDEVICEALRVADIKDKSLAVMIGDREQDILGAKRNGIDSVGARYGFCEENELENAGADYIIDTPSELLGLV